MIICTGRHEGNPFLGTEFYAYCVYCNKEYECHENTDCNYCVINSGTVSPITGKEFKGNRQKYIDACKERVCCYDR